MHSKAVVKGLLFVASAWLTGCGNSPDVSMEVSGPAPVAACPRASWIAGSSELCDGQLVYRDYVYDDYGADAGIVSPDPVVLNVTTRLGQFDFPTATTPGLLSPTAGDRRYPAGRENTADLVVLILAIDGDELVVDFELNTMFDADDALAAIAIDTDNDSATGGGPWTPLKTSSTGWDVLKVFGSGNPATNHITGRLPLPPGDTWRVQAALAQADGTVMNVAYRGVDEESKADGLQQQFLPGAGNFWEDRQAAALGAGDISAFGETISVADLRSGTTRAAAPPTGFHQRVYTSAYTLGEGVVLRGVPGRHGDTRLPCEQYFHYLGRYQPYGIYVPTRPGPHGVQLVMHGCEANHSSQVNQSNMQQQFGEDLNRILVSPLARGPYGFYSNIAERDVLDALADVEATYDTDPERVFSGGYSMGGYGAFRLAALYPDRFAGVVSWVGFSGDLANTPLPGNPLPDIFATLGAASPIPNFTNGTSIGAAENVIDFLGNLRHVPSENIYAAQDELVHLTTQLALAQRFDAVGVPYRFAIHTPAEHLTFMILDQWQKEADGTRNLTRVHDPLRVTYRTDLAFDYPEYGLRHDRAYWVSGITARATGYSDVDLYAPGCGGSQWTFLTGTDVGVAPVPWVGTHRVISGSALVASASVLEGTLRNVASVTVDADATCFSGKAVHYTIDSDGPVTLRLSDGRSRDLPGGSSTGDL
ncbi:MAG: hypothetical protein K0Q76_3034 [Panacagrimonas sp.]|jgi:pimeloyl-ACP methyl ester carboxylesterase|nr:hypothetical protein [Panacagrimonas sp.]MCC2657926.1 hypothetical protein [Panacagrimonas sp.]